MDNFRISRMQITLFLGDLTVILAAALWGLSSHRMLDQAGGRIWSLMIPWLVAWVLVGVHTGAFDEEYALRPKQLWRPFWGMVLASPLAGLLRGLWLGKDVVPIFVIVFGGVCALGVLIWRMVFNWQYLRNQREALNG